LLLGVPEAVRHFGDIIAGEFLMVLRAFGVIALKIGYFTLNDAENNIIAMVAIGRELGFNGRFRRGRYTGYIINLAAKALLFSSSNDAFEEQLNGISVISDDEYQLQLKKKPVDKLHNLVVNVRNMHQLFHKFAKI
jgi:hypothetical protein